MQNYVLPNTCVLVCKTTTAPKDEHFSVPPLVYLNDCSICTRGFPNSKGFFQGFPYFLLNIKRKEKRTVEMRYNGIHNELGFPASHYAFGLDEFLPSFFWLSPLTESLAIFQLT